MKVEARYCEPQDERLEPWSVSKVVVIRKYAIRKDQCIQGDSRLETRRLFGNERWLGKKDGATRRETRRGHGGRAKPFKDGDRSLREGTCCVTHADDVTHANANAFQPTQLPFMETHAYERKRKRSIYQFAISNLQINVERSMHYSTDYNVKLAPRHLISQQIMGTDSLRSASTPSDAQDDLKHTGLCSAMAVPIYPEFCDESGASYDSQSFLETKAMEQIVCLAQGFMVKQPELSHERPGSWFTYFYYHEHRFLKTIDIPGKFAWIALYNGYFCGSGFDSPYSITWNISPIIGTFVLWVGPFYYGHSILFSLFPSIRILGTY
ncbi:hypothetical protein ARMSODRAFT_981520 [Armillaria solidipes]|uniref:Uncharacterized protein n=1 Tax=Armillaria solidipes TaxID=1076256 RepID=A0A2H3AXB7_9AGAR|nr:hypothetical protein ARMSODRAFT_981520 [Armillaria solidipes]